MTITHCCSRIPLPLLREYAFACLQKTVGINDASKRKKNHNLDVTTVQNGSYVIYEIRNSALPVKNTQIEYNT